MNKLTHAIALRKQEKYRESNQLLLEIWEENRNDPEINYQCAWSFDVLGEESKAVPYYEKAIELGLSGKNLEGALLGLGSTYRTLGNYYQSKRVFEKGKELFPNNRAFDVFFAMTLYNLNQHDQAMGYLLTCLLDTTTNTDIKNYEQAIRFYADKLDQVWT
ncbi:tetratricopeptide repeat protein [Ornithinibacillus massiliensis]|uniref:Tetratricopeptide repeat protein n=1 Tax=Ornithinibacillus massiliensis TaxID=1944633 RepID=A0ABS5M9J2_9BACI|nr:tetratricopeptide repeat protein [Ornithinibacillus massiliensis]MBS3678981.1 tetratricopeptide repeat protein [Ornithinibacillus massiliensis]